MVRGVDARPSVAPPARDQRGWNGDHPSGAPRITRLGIASPTKERVWSGRRDSNRDPAVRAGLPLGAGQRVLDVAVLLAFDPIRPGLMEHPDAAHSRLLHDAPRADVH